MSVSKMELAKTLQEYKGGNWELNPVFKKIYSEPYCYPGGQPFGCLVGDYYFDHTHPDVELLSGIAAVAAAAHVPFMSGASLSVLQMDSWPELSNRGGPFKILSTPEYAKWRNLRKSADSRYIGLTVPRFLARLPYGARTQPAGEFDFQEDTDDGVSKYCWANSAYAMAVNINRAFALYGWCARINGIEGGGLVEGIPVHAFPAGEGEAGMRSTESDIDERQEVMLAKSGFMPLIHWKNTDYAAFFCAQSLHEPARCDDPEAAAGAALSARLPYVFSACRFAHYLKCMPRDRIGSLEKRADMEDCLQRWIDRCVDGNASSESKKARKPLALAMVKIKDAEGSPGYHTLHFYLQSHFQLEAPPLPLELVSRLPSVKSSDGRK